MVCRKIGVGGRYWRVEMSKESSREIKVESGRKIVVDREESLRDSKSEQGRASR